jgi:hypothetical protein
MTVSSTKASARIVHTRFLHTRPQFLTKKNGSTNVRTSSGSTHVWLTAQYGGLSPCHLVERNPTHEDTKELYMRCFWEQIGVLGPTYRLLGRGWTNHDIAKRLGRTDEVIDSCVTWILRFLRIGTRAELVTRSTGQQLLNGNMVAVPVPNRSHRI